MRATIVICMALVTPIEAQQEPPASGYAGGKWQYDAIQTSAADVEKLEAALARNPDDLEALSKLISYYVYNLRQDDVDRHVLWLIEHHPGSELAGAAPASGKFSLSEPAHLRKKQLWLKQVALHPSDARVLGNAGLYFAEREQRTALGLLRRALELQPDVREWVISVDRLYALGAREFFRHQSGSFGSQPVLLSPDDAASMKEDLDREANPHRIGSVGRMLSMSWVSPESMEYAGQLLRRAQALEPDGNWLQPLRPSAPGPPAGSSALAIRPQELAALLVEKNPPAYPPLAQQARIQGTVTLQVTVGSDGRVKRMAAVSGHPLLVPAAMEAVRTWVYRPYLLAGKAVDVAAEASVDFRLPR